MVVFIGVLCKLRRGVPSIVPCDSKEIMLMAVFTQSRGSVGVRPPCRLHKEHSPCLIIIINGGRGDMLPRVHTFQRKSTVREADRQTGESIMRWNRKEFQIRHTSDALTETFTKTYSTL